MKRRPPGVAAGMDGIHAAMLSPSLAERVADLPAADRAALAHLVNEIGEEGFERLVTALAPGGRPSEYLRRLPLLRQMAAETASSPNKTRYAIATALANSPKGKEVGHSTDSLRRWLVREWDEHGSQLLREHRAASRRLAWDYGEINKTISAFRKTIEDLRRSAFNEKSRT